MMEIMYRNVENPKTVRILLIRSKAVMGTLSGGRGSELKLPKKICFIKTFLRFGRRLSFCHLFLPTS